MDRCRWCRRPLEQSSGPGRPREFCSQRCRQWDWVARQRAGELELAEGELVITRTALDELSDRVYILSCAVADARQDLATGKQNLDSVTEMLMWVIEAAESVVSAQVGPSSPISPV